jgi:hypothetical protein
MESPRAALSKREEGKIGDPELERLTAELALLKIRTRGVL